MSLSCSRVSSLPCDLVFQLSTDPFLDTLLTPTLQLSLASHVAHTGLKFTMTSLSQTGHISYLCHCVSPGLQSGEWTVVVLLNRKMNELTNFQIWPKFTFQLWRIHQGPSNWRHSLLSTRTRNLSTHAAPLQPRITYQDLHRLSQTLHHLLIIFILLLRLGQQSRELCHSEERGIALSPG